MAGNEEYSRSRSRNRYMGGAYVGGTAAPSLPEIHRPETPGGTGQRENRKVRRNQERSMYITLPYLVFLSVVSLLLILACVNFVRAQSQVAEQRRNIRIAQTRLQTLQADNDALENQLDAAVDLDAVYHIAVEEYGMVYPDTDQIIYFDRTESGYVRQYEDIPTD